MKANKSRSLAWMLAAFALSRVAYYFAGLRFDTSPLFHYWQYIDPVLMRTDLLRSLFYLHMQPPGHNLMVGAIYKWFPDSYDAVFWTLHLAMGLAIGWTLFRLLRAFAIAEKPALVIAILFLVSPGVVLYEDSLTYEYPILLLLQCSALALLQLLRLPTLRHSLLFFSLIGALMLLRNTFHLLYLLLLAAGLFFFLPQARKVVALGALPALAVNTAVYCKNQLLFGVFVASTWAGMATGVVTTHQMSSEEIDRMIAAGQLTAIARIPVFSEVEAYRPFVSFPPPAGIPVLDQPTTSSGHVNYNHLVYLQVHPQYAANAKSVLLHFPKAYVRSVLIAWFSFFLPPSDMHTLDRLRQPIESFDRLFSAVFFGQWLRPESRKDLRAILAQGKWYLLPLYTGTYLIVLIPLICGWALWRLFSKTPGLSREQRGLLGFLLFTMLFSTAISNSISSFECNRYRFPLDGFFLIILAMAGQWGWRRWLGQPAGD